MLPDGKFVDLGSGTGRLVYASQLGAFRELIGIELLHGYVRSSRETLAHVECTEHPSAGLRF